VAYGFGNWDGGFPNPVSSGEKPNGVDLVSGKKQDYQRYRVAEGIRPETGRTT